MPQGKHGRPMILNRRSRPSHSEPVVAWPGRAPRSAVGYLIAALGAACVAAGLASPAVAAVVEVPPPSEDEIYSQWYKNPEWRRQEKFRTVIRLLSDGHAEEARRELAAYIRKFPRDSAALELAGLVFLKQGDAANAEISLREAVRLNPQRHSARTKLAVAMAMLGKVEGAGAQLERAVLGQPLDPIPHYYLAWLKYRQGNVSAAVSHLESYFRYQTPPPEHLEPAHLMLAQMLNASARYRETIQTLSIATAPNADPDFLRRAALLKTVAYLEIGDAANARAQFAIARRNLPAGDTRGRLLEAQLARLDGAYDRARSILKALIDEDRDARSSAYYELARVALASDNAEQARAHLDKALEATDRDDRVPLLRDLTALLTSQDQTDEAIAILTKAANDSPERPWIRYLLAETQTYSGQIDAGLTTLKHVVTRHAEFAPAYFLMGVIYWNKREQKEAEDAFRKAARLDPTNVRVWLSLVGLFDAQSRVSDARQALQSALQISPGDPSLLYELATFDYAAGDVERATAIYREIVRLNPNHAAALNNLALILAEHDGDLSEARRLVEKSTELVGEVPEVRETRAWILFREGETERALSLLTGAIDDLPQDAMAQYHLGAILLDQGKKEAAAVHLRKALLFGIPDAVRAKVVSLLEQSE